MTLENENVAALLSEINLQNKGSAKITGLAKGEGKINWSVCMNLFSGES